MARGAYYFASRPAGVSHSYPILVFDPQARLHQPLTIFAKEATRRLSASSVQVYLHSILPFFAFLDGAPPSATPRGSWYAEPESVRHAVGAFMEEHLNCDIREWVPQIIDDPTFPVSVLTGGRKLSGWGTREECVTRMLFETGGRIFEVTGLTLGDWVNRGLTREATAASKGSHGRRERTKDMVTLHSSRHLSRQLGSAMCTSVADVERSASAS